MIYKRYLKTDEVALLMSKSPKAIRMMVYRGQLPFIKIGRTVRFEEGEIYAYMSKHRVAPFHREVKDVL